MYSEDLEDSEGPGAVHRRLSVHARRQRLVDDERLLFVGAQRQSFVRVELDSIETILQKNGRRRKSSFVHHVINTNAKYIKLLCLLFRKYGLEFGGFPGGTCLVLGYYRLASH